MEKKLLILSISSILFISVSIFSQASDKLSATPAITPLNNTFNSNHLPNAENTFEPTTKTPLVVAKVTVDNIEVNNNAIAVREPRTKQELLHFDKRVSTQTEVSASQYKHPSEAELESLREVFLLAEKSVKTKNKQQYLSDIEHLKDYPLLPYLSYQWLKVNLNETEQVKQFLSQNSSSRYASKLKHRWLFHLAKQKNWSLFEEYYTGSSNTKLKCYHLQAQYKTGDKIAALKSVEELWNVGYSQPRVCDTIFRQFRKSDYYTADLIWQRFDKALQNNKVSLAIYLKSELPEAQQATANLWLKLHRRPARHIQTLLKQKPANQTPQMFVHTISRLAKNDITSAIRIWDTNKQNYRIDPRRYNKLENKLAFQLAFKQENGAYERFSQLKRPDSSSKEWRIRVALSEQNWPNVITAIKALDASEQQDEKWQYWLARAHLEMGDTELSDRILTQLSMQRDFYGYLAADKTNNQYQLAHDPIQVTEQEIYLLSNSKPFQIAHELMKLNRVNEAKQQWWHALRQLNNHEITIAAKLAQQWQWNEIAIFTVAKVKHWDDIEMRFPISYSEKIHKNSEKNLLDPAIVFGLVRRESAFNENALSPAGARGLMQIMPRTGKQIAKNLNERWRGKQSLDNAETNIKYGSFYYQQLLKKFDGHYALALAAYNAGPERVKKWLPKTEPVPADIWIETIPYHETREYVRAVLTYALIYQQRFQSKGLTMSGLTQEVAPLTPPPNHSLAKS